jgi:zinc transporter ZupT
VDLVLGRPIYSYSDSDRGLGIALLLTVVVPVAAVVGYLLARRFLPRLNGWMQGLVAAGITYVAAAGSLLYAVTA